MRALPILLMIGSHYVAPMHKPCPLQIYGKAGDGYQAPMSRFF